MKSLAITNSWAELLMYVLITPPVVFSIMGNDKITISYASSCQLNFPSSWHNSRHQ